MVPFYRGGGVTFSAFLNRLLHSPGRAGRSEGPPGAKAGAGPTPNCFRTLQEPGRGGPDYGRRDLGPAPRGRCDHAVQKCGALPPRTLENAVQENFGGEKQYFCGESHSAWPTVGFVTHSWETAEKWRGWRKPMRESLKEVRLSAEEDPS